MKKLVLQIFAATIVLLIPLIIVLVFSNLVADDTNRSAAAVLKFTNALKRLPTQLPFYGAFAVVVGICLAWRCWQFLHVVNEYKTNSQDKQYNIGLTARDWWVALGLRKRAISLRTRADLLLVSVLAALFGGIYLILFVLPGITESDQIQARQIRFEERFGYELQALVDGKYWIRGEAPSDVDLFSRTNIARAATTDRVTTYANPEDSWVENSLALGNNDSMAVLEFSSDGGTGLVATKSSIHFTKDQGRTWKVLILETKDDRRVDYIDGPRSVVRQIVLSSDGKTILVGRHLGPPFLTTDAGEQWHAVNVKLKRHESIAGVALSADGTTGLIVGDQNSVYISQDGGTRWKYPMFFDRNPINVQRIVLSTHGKYIAVLGSGRTVYLSADHGDNWVESTVPVDLLMTMNQQPANLEISPNGQVMVVGGETRHGPLFPVQSAIVLSTDGGKTWKLQDFTLKEGELLYEMHFNHSGNVGILTGSRGSVLLTKNSGINWEFVELDLADDWVVSGLSEDGLLVVLAAGAGPVYRSLDSGNHWEPLDLIIQTNEKLIEATVTPDGNVVTIGLSRGMVFTTNAGVDWRSTKLSLPIGERMIASSVSPDGRTVAVTTSRDNIYVSHDRGSEWSSSKLSTEGFERLEKVAFSDNGIFGIILGSSDSLYITRNRGTTWEAVELALDSRDNIDDVAWLLESGHFRSQNAHANASNASQLESGRNVASKDKEILLGAFVVKTQKSQYFYLREYSELSDWRDWSPEAVRRTMERNQLLRSTPIYSEISKFMFEETHSEENVATSSAVPNDDNVATTNRFLDNITIMRVVTATILFFLVHLLVRLYQYSLRLAAFWESRSDAILLCSSFAKGESESFDQLIYAMAPDSYDFKGTPRSSFSMQRLVDKLTG